MGICFLNENLECWIKDKLKKKSQHKMLTLVLVGRAGFEPATKGL